MGRLGKMAEVASNTGRQYCEATSIHGFSYWTADIGLAYWVL